MSTSGFIPTPARWGLAIGRMRRATATSVGRFLQSAVAIAFTIVGIVAYCVIELTHGRRGW